MKIRLYILFFPLLFACLNNDCTLKKFTIIDCINKAQVQLFEQKNDDHISIDDISFRIKKHINYLKSLHTKKDSLLRRVVLFSANFFCGKNNDKIFLKNIYIDNDIGFKNLLICKCVESINLEKTLKPIIKTWKIFEKNGFKDEILFLKEFSVLLMLVYTKMLENINKGCHTRVSLPEVVTLYHQVSSLPIMRLLYVLDEFLDQFAIIVKDYQSGSLNLKQWLRSRGWIIPVLAIAISIKILLKKSDNYYGYNGYSYGGYSGSYGFSNVQDSQSDGSPYSSYR